MRAVPLHDPSKEDVTCPRVARIRNTPPWLLCREISSLARLSQENSDETGQDFCQYGLAAPNMIAVIGGSALNQRLNLAHDVWPFRLRMAASAARVPSRYPSVQSISLWCPDRLFGLSSKAHLAWFTHRSIVAASISA